MPPRSGGKPAALPPPPRAPSPPIDPEVIDKEIQALCTTDDQRKVEALCSAALASRFAMHSLRLKGSGVALRRSFVRQELALADKRIDELQRAKMLEMR